MLDLPDATTPAPASAEGSGSGRVALGARPPARPPDPAQGGAAQAHGTTLALRAQGFALGAARQAHETPLALRAQGFAFGAARQAHAEAAGVKPAQAAGRSQGRAPDRPAEGTRATAQPSRTPEAPTHDVTLQVHGRVQGVGFRPFVFRLAHELALDGWVRNDGGGVTIALRGPAGALARFGVRLRSELPPLARVDDVQEQAGAAIDGPGFRIADSAHTPVCTGIVPDAAPCEACLDDLFDPRGRRWRYAFTNCTHCGPRFTITARLPYDRPSTSMAGFVQCPACQREYDDPRDRRFHAQPNACPLCGPRLWLADAHGVPLDCDDAIAAALARVAGGQIVAVKGLGGFHLVCDARNAAAVARLRERKHRDEKPFAVMVANGASLAGLAGVDAAAAAALQAIERPIVLLPKAAGCDAALAGIAPGLAQVGVMLPSAPLQWLLYHEAAGRPAGRAWLRAAQDLVLVMTSANPGGEPLVVGNDEAVRRLGAAAGLADAFVMHDRDVLVRCDDSVVRVDVLAAADPVPDPARGLPAAPPPPALSFVRRARGYTPAAIRLADAAPPVLALGAYLKTTACLTRGAEAFLSQHIGDLDNAPSRSALEEAAFHLQGVLEVRPAAIAHDLHPDIYSTQLAQQLAAQLGVPAIGVQHHHAHIAAIAAEHGHPGPLLGLALDGVGYGSDDDGSGTAWGGELLALDGARCTRLGHLRALPLPGGDRAAREPWRMAAAVLHALGRADEIAPRFVQQPAAPTVAQMLCHGLRCPPTTSAGRWFDAAAGLLGVREVMAYEGQAAMLLEALAAQRPTARADGALYRIDRGVLDLLPLAARLAAERDAAAGAALFHATLAQALADWASAAARAHGLSAVALGGGCFLNAILSARLTAALRAQGLQVLAARQAPPNDGGLSLGQAWVARQLLKVN